ncbi:hypothetical protein ACIHFD_04620 [Nonomuraea sp. NPDC051941]|uniref:hypothetical protein n=1 Tax=Nonomuraea sp. NPDC051941 TaxID=3364373 RepID=UPI0037C5E63E
MTTLQRMLAAVPLTGDERAAVDNGHAALDRLLDQLADVPTPAGSTPRQIGPLAQATLQAGHRDQPKADLVRLRAPAQPVPHEAWMGNADIDAVLSSFHRDGTGQDGSAKSGGG